MNQNKYLTMFSSKTHQNEPDNKGRQHKILEAERETGKVVTDSAD